LYEDASITRKEMLILLNAYFFRHNSSKAGVSDMLKIASLLVPKGESACIPPTYFKFIANLNTDISKVKKALLLQNVCKARNNIWSDVS